MLIHPGAKWVNRWPESSFVALLKMHGEWLEVTIFLTNSAGESGLCERLACILTRLKFSVMPRCLESSCPQVLASTPLRRNNQRNYIAHLACGLPT